jgi:N-methylhydantoinase A
MALDVAGAVQALEQQVAQPLGLTPETAAEGILQVATAHMAAAIRLSLFEKGLDPQDFALLAFGGAGGLHALETAAELGVGRVIIPRDPGTLSAWGMLFADITHDLARSYLVPARIDVLPALNTLVAQLYRDGQSLLEQDDVAAGQRDFQLALDMRYPGQAYEIVVACTGTQTTLAIDETTLDRVVQEFHHLHQTQYAHADTTVTPEIVTLRLSAIGRLSKPRQRPYETTGNSIAKSRRRLFLNNIWQDLPVFERARLHPAMQLHGPALIEESHSTLLLPQGWQLTVAASGELLADSTT